MQGYGSLSDGERRGLWLGLRFSPPWIAAIAVAFWAGAPTVAWVLAVPLLVVGATVATTNWCLPSLIYGLLHRRQASEAASGSTASLPGA